MGPGLAYRSDEVANDVDSGSDEAGAEDDDEGQLGVEEVVPPSSLEVAEVVAQDPDVDQT